MTTFNARSTSEESWWEVQHRYPDHDQQFHREEWATSDLAQFGAGAVALLREAQEADALRRNPQRWVSEDAAVTFLARFARAAQLHKTMEFRVARVTARIEMESVLVVAPPPICGRYGYYGAGGSSHATVDLYCQQEPGHSGDHGPKKEAA